MSGNGGTSPGIAEPKNVQQAPQMPANTPIIMMYTTPKVPVNKQ